MEGHLFLSSFWSLSRQALHQEDSNPICGTPYTPTVTMKSLVEIGQLRRALYPCGRNHPIRATQASLVSLHAHALQTMQVWWKSVSKEGHFTLAAQTTFRPYLD
jgi:hypothetical protein